MYKWHLLCGKLNYNNIYFLLSTSFYPSVEYCYKLHKIVHNNKDL